MLAQAGEDLASGPDGSEFTDLRGEFAALGIGIRQGEKDPHVLTEVVKGVEQLLQLVGLRSSIEGGGMESDEQVPPAEFNPELLRELRAAEEG